MKRIMKRLAAAACIVAFASSTFAVPTLTIFDGTTTIVVTDNALGVDIGGVDVNGALGATTWIGSIGVWTVNVDTGFTKPLLGSGVSPHMDLNFSAVSTSGGPAGTLKLTFSDNGFTYTGGLTDAWGGTTGGSVINKVFVNSTQIAGLGPVGPGPFSGSTSGLATLTPTDVLSLVVEITHGAGVVASTGDKEVQVPDGGATLMLLGSALAGLGMLRRRFSAKA